MKKSTSKKPKFKSAAKPKPVAKKSSISLKNKKTKPKLHTSSAAPVRKATAASPPKNASRKPAVATTSARPATPLVQQKILSQNGKAAVEKERKLEKPVDQPVATAKKASPPPEPAPVKTYLSAKELKEFKALLLAKRAELAGDVENLTAQALNRKSGGVNEQSSMPIHMADLGSDTWEQDFTLGLIANEQALVREIDDALSRIEDRTYGICVATDKPISLERLRAKPWAKYCIEYARLREEGRAP